MHESAQPPAQNAAQRAISALVGLVVAVGASAQPGAGPEPLIKRGSLTHVSDHVYVILDDNVGFVPNVGIVVGQRATLIVDTGLGQANGRIVLEEARSLGVSDDYYLTATHFHPEHDLGATAFPDSAKMLRWSVQQAEAGSVGEETIRRFAEFSPALKKLLDGARFRPADIVFEDAIVLDLGGVRVRVWGVGPNHTLGDTAFFVEDDRVLFTGDTVMSVFPAVNGDSADLAKWLGNLDTYEQLNPVVIVPAHGRLGDVNLVRRYRDYLTSVQRQVRDLARRGVSIDAAVERLVEPLEEEFVDLRPAAGSAEGRIAAAIRAAYRE
jgi:glyoxylase-like metal-dependent hydrolase (beta-lactamase superfamily II)